MLNFETNVFFLRGAEFEESDFILFEFLVLIALHEISSLCDDQPIDIIHYIHLQSCSFDLIAQRFSPGEGATVRFK